MVFCGRPSRACHRCRERRLKCDLCQGSCGQCNRAQVTCPGYRDLQQLRIRNESQMVRSKAIAKSSKTIRAEPHSLALALEWRARDAFFAYHVSGASKSWDFLMPFHDPIFTPDYLALSIDAVSLAYLARQVHSESVLNTAKQKYVAALHLTMKALQSPAVSVADTALLAPLLLDIFEKITNTESRHEKSWTSHVDGALTIVRLHGLENFQDPAAVRVLGRLSTNLLISCVTSEKSVPDGLIALRAHIAKYLDARDPKWRLSNLVVHYANLRSDIRSGLVSVRDCIVTSLKLDAESQALALDFPLAWRHKTTIMDGESDRIYKCRYDSYRDRHTTQTWNVLRMVRILLNESAAEQYLLLTKDFETDDCADFITLIKAGNETLAGEICASVPQYIDCYGAARLQLLTSKSSELTQHDVTQHSSSHTHSPSQDLDCYTLIFPLYVVGRSCGPPAALKSWVLQQLRYLSSHFGIRNALLVAQILESEEDVDPWTVYTMLGSYAFIA